VAKSEESKAHDRETARRLIGLDRLVKKTAPKPAPDPKGGKKK
jgi:hypothetical protein